jgi:hypothetical protein
MAKPTKAEGAKALKGGAAIMKRLCDSCCKDCDCTPAQCKKEAQAIVDAIVGAWNDNYGKGSNTSKDNIGGYLCWDWARFFRDAANDAKPKCWIVEYEMAWKGPRDPTKWQACHFWLALYACRKKDECKVMIDDSWFDGDFIHQPPWPGKDWPSGNKKLPPLTPQK